MSDIKEKRAAQADETYEEKSRPRRLWFLALLLLLLVSVTSSCIGYILGSTGNISRYTGQIIDTIIISSSHQDSSLETYYTVDINGTIQYSDKTPYINGTVELRSEVRRTTTDELGRFSFIDVPEGKHTLSLIENDTVLVSKEIVIERSTLITSIEATRLSDGSYVLNVPVNIFKVEVFLVLNGSELSVAIGDFDVVATPSPSATPTAPVDPSSPVSPTAPVEPTMPVTPTPGVTTPVSPEPTPSPTVAPPVATPRPGISVNDDIKPTQKWTQSTAIDIFSERAGNSGVTTIDGKNVIAPGSHGKYLFRIKNEESSSVKYSIVLTDDDENSPKLPMRYRLMKGVYGDGYIGGSDWKKASELSVTDSKLGAGEYTYYTLEWKWDSKDDKEDTAIGTQTGDPVYILEIKISAKAN